MTIAPGFTLHLETTLAAPPSRVFELLTDPGEVQRWWGPHGYTTTRIDMDLRVGGSFRFTMQPPDGEAFHLRGAFIEIDPDERLVYTFAWEEPDPDDVKTLVTLSMREAEAGSTELVLDQRVFATEARMALHHGGWTDSFETLTALAAHRSAL
jgi:uncharacterized protein YndB with AHSA1/START domain